MQRYQPDRSSTSTATPIQSGDDQYNFDLSQRRALAVANYLSAQGVDQRRFAVTGFGKTKPDRVQRDGRGQGANRRVEIQLSPLT